MTWSYDQNTNGIGHLTKVIDQAGSATYSYDPLGRMSSESRTIAGVTKNMNYTYNLDGSVASVTYPSGATITYIPDSAGRMLKAVDSANPSAGTSGQAINYVTGATYGPDSALRGFVSGQSSTFGGITNTFVYNNRLQPCRMAASSAGAVPTNCMNSWGNVLDLSYDFHLGNGDNGNVYGITNYRDQTRNQTFTYDPLNRLLSAQNAGTDCSVRLLGNINKFWGNTYTYDAWGNLLQKTLMTGHCSGENLSANVDAATNRLQSGYGYDIAGNMTYDATTRLHYAYDQENRITGTAPFTYTYDADGNRVEKSNGSTQPPTGMLYWYMSLGIVGESDLAGNLQSEYVFFDGERVARKDFPGNTVSYYFSDHLKTASVITDAVGTIKSESDYYPWGGELLFTNNDSNHYKFTDKERDAESGLDYFGARYYSNGLGRWISADWSASPVPIPYADLHDPQTLNLYGYVRGLPTTKADIDGHGWWDKFKNSFGEAGCWCEGEEAKNAIEKRRNDARVWANEVEKIKKDPALQQSMFLIMLFATGDFLNNLAGDQAMVAEEVETTASEVESVELQPYRGPGGGHHVPAKSAFRGAAGYDENAALAVPNAEMARSGVDHTAVTSAQQNLYKAFAQTGQKLTWESVSKIETQALVRGGMNPNMAQQTVQKAVQGLKDAGVAGPTRIPWGGK